MALTEAQVAALRKLGIEPEAGGYSHSDAAPEVYVIDSLDYVPTLTSQRLRHLADAAVELEAVGLRMQMARDEKPPRGVLFIVASEDDVPLDAEGERPGPEME